MPSDLESSADVKQRPSSPVSILNNLARPSRLRSKIVAAIIIGAILIFGALAKGHTEELTDYVKSSLPSKPTKFSGNWWNNDDEEPTIIANITTPELQAKFHLLIPAAGPSLSLSRTLVSAAVLNYPPTTLIGYDAEEKTVTIKSILKWLHTKEASDDDLVMIIDSQTWLQLPAQILIERYLSMVTRLNAANRGSQTLDHRGEEAKQARVFFPATKRCELRIDPSDPTSDHSSLCNGAPFGPVPADTYGPETDLKPDSKSSRPRFLNSRVHIGTAAGLRTLYTAAFDALEPGGSSNEENVFTTLFLAQTLARAKPSSAPAAGAAKGNKFRRWMLGRKGKTHHLSEDLRAILSERIIEHTPNIDMDAVCDLGITLDYTSSLFQSMLLSEADIRPLTYHNTLLINSPKSPEPKKKSKQQTSLVSLPPDLQNTTLPFKLLPIPTVGELARTPWLPTDLLPLTRTWADIPLLSNIFIPGASVPAGINFDFGIIYQNSAKASALKKKMWDHLWFAPHARALMHRYLRSQNGHVGAIEAENGGRGWWNMKGGVGGVWTDGGIFLEWNEVCGKFDEEIFGDGLGELGKEEGKGARRIGMLGEEILEVAEKKKEGKEDEVVDPIEE